MVYDSVRGKVVMFGGYYWSNGHVFYDETWEYDGVNWTQVATVSNPDGRNGHKMAYDSVRGKVVMFGGFDSSYSYLNDTWEYDGGSLAQYPLACFEFDNNSVASSQPTIATVSDLDISNEFMFGGPAGESWLCLTTQWNASGGTISFTVTPNSGESIDYSAFEWSAVTTDPSTSDSVTAMTLYANGVTVGGVDPLTHNTVHTIDLSSMPGLAGASVPVTFVMDFVGNPSGAGAYEMGYIKLLTTSCVLAIDNVAPAALPVVTSECFTLTGDCFDQVTEVQWQGAALPQCTPANWGQGCYTIVDPHTIRVCPPLCVPVNTYEIKLLRGAEMVQHSVQMVLSVDGQLACPATHPTGTDLCLAVSTGQLPQPNAVFVILSPSNLPSIVPGFLEMQLGNMLTQYACGAAHISECFEDCYPIPAGLAGQTWYFQSIIWNPYQTVLPLPVTNLCSTTFY
jgi:hypothetical protein